MGYRYFLLIGDLFSKYINAISLRDQCAESITQALCKEWILIHGLPNFLLSDQGSNIDGNIVREVCEKFGIEKRRSSAYHSQGNGFAERSIRNIKEILRTHLFANKLPQNSWRRLLKEMIFVLNTTISCSTKCSGDFGGGARGHGPGPRAFHAQEGPRTPPPPPNAFVRMSKSIR